MALDPPRSIVELNARAERWLAAYVHSRPHRATGEPPAERLKAELGVLGRLPNVRYDTARREARIVSAPFPLIEVDTVSYSVPPELVGATVEVRLPVDAGVVEVRHQGRTVATHTQAPPGSPPVWDPPTAAPRRRSLWPPRTAVTCT